MKNKTSDELYQDYLDACDACDAWDYWDAETAAYAVWKLCQDKLKEERDG